MTSMVSHLAHVSLPSGPPVETGFPVLWAAIGVIVFGLWCEHTLVLGGAGHLRRIGRRATAIALIAALAVVTTPSAADAQDLAEAQPFPGLPDLISNPMIIWFQRNVVDDDLGLRRVVAFEGILQNAGEGSLDLAGNPQVPGGMKQRVFDGENWEVVGTPTVRYETSDGHNHFHLMRAVDYSLWDEGQTEQLLESSKVGFCLSDVEQTEFKAESYYTREFASNFCGENDPDLTELRMGITPGWSDVYGPNVTLQWVDISETAPGRYWIGGITDPLNEIVESDETNNGTVFSRTKFTAAGWSARRLEPVAVAGPTDIELKAVGYGNVGARAFVIDKAPEHGRLLVPVGADLFESTVTYVPDAGFNGTDSFSYHAHDISTPFPLTPVSVRVELTVATGSDDSEVESPWIDGEGVTIEVDASTTVTQFDDVTVAASFAGANGDSKWYASNLPPGLRIGPDTGVITGRPTIADTWTSEVHAVTDGIVTTSEFVWVVVEPESAPTLRPTTAQRSTAVADVVDFNLGFSRRDARYEGDGLPEGVWVDPGQPHIRGQVTEIGTFDVVVRELIGDDLISEFEFEWTVRPSATVAFAL